MAETTAKRGKKLPQITVDKVAEFYNSNIHGRLMAGRKDVISVTIDGERTLKQKRLLLLNLKELFASFKESNPEHIIGFSSFAKLRPKYCILSGATGTHFICVCTIHQNIKLMLDAIGIKNLTANTEITHQL